MAIRIITDSACDIPAEVAAKYNIEVMPIRINFDGEEYLDGVTMNHEQFFDKLIETDVLPKTSQVPPYEYEEKFKEITDAGDSAICITVSSKLSGCYQSANIAVDGFEDKIKIVDSLNACVSMQILVIRAAELRDEGKSLEEIEDALNKEKFDIKLIALIDTLEYLKKGGRISSAVAMAGSVLSIKPVVTITDGEIAVLGKARGSKNANNLLNQLIEKEGKINFKKPFCLGYSGNSSAMLDKYIEDNRALYSEYEGELPVTSIGCAVGTHAGPGCIALAFFV